MCIYLPADNSNWIRRHTDSEDKPKEIAIYQTVCENMPDPNVLCRLVDLISTRLNRLWYLPMHWLLHHKIRVSPNETRIKTYDVDFANWVSDVKKETQNSLIASKSSFYFKHSLNDRRQLSLNQNVLL
jgi:hypothetical protein